MKKKDNTGFYYPEDCRDLVSIKEARDVYEAYLWIKENASYLLPITPQKLLKGYILFNKATGGNKTTIATIEKYKNKRGN